MPTFHVPGDGRWPWIEADDGSVYVISDEASLKRAQAAGFAVDMDFDEHVPLSRTPLQNHHEDPLVCDPRPIRLLNAQEAATILKFASVGAHAAVAGFETWRGRDRWLYLDVLGVGRDPDEAEKYGLPVGPIEAGWLKRLRMVGDQLAMRMADPWGR